MRLRLLFEALRLGVVCVVVKAMVIGGVVTSAAVADSELISLSLHVPSLRYVFCHTAFQT